MSKLLLAFLCVFLTGAFGVFCAWVGGNDFERGHEGSMLLLFGVFGCLMGGSIFGIIENGDFCRSTER